MISGMCFRCLQRRLQSHFSDQLFFCYGISDSALPFGSSAVVEVSMEEKVDIQVRDEFSSQFVLLVIRDEDDPCLTRYVNEHFSGEPQLSPNYTKRCKDLVESEGSYMWHYNVFSRLIMALAPIAYVGSASWSTITDVVSNFLRASLEDYVLSSLDLFVLGKATGGDSKSFLHLVGMPKFAEKVIPCCVRHPNLIPVLGILKMPGYVNILYPKSSYTLENLLYYSPKALNDDWCIRFLTYQILSALAYIHGLGAAHGNLCPSTVLLTDPYWVWLNIFNNLGTEESLGSNSTITQAIRCMDECPSVKLSVVTELTVSSDYQTVFQKWWTGELSNYDYLLFLNKLAGRRWDDPTFHTVMPWVIDFSVKPDDDSDNGWRDLRKSKWRLAKGDEQLDFTYSTSEIPHHISDECLSELAVCSYKARRLPLKVLRSAVRSVYEPNEYPSTMQRLYQWTPDECIPEFYSDPQIFTSLHSDMCDLLLPSWAENPEEFICSHRAALESDHVSQQIHHWFDITFGYKMSGQAAIEAKNVMLVPSDPNMPRSTGRRQLFTQPHPARLRSKLNKYFNAEKDLVEESSKKFVCDADYLEKLEAAFSFSEHSRYLSPKYRYSLENMNGKLKMDAVLTQETDSYTLREIELSNFSECLEDENDQSLTRFEEILLWKNKISVETCSLDAAEDIFSTGCILAELYLKKPLFDSLSLSMYKQCGVLPGLLEELPPYVKVFVEAFIQRDWKRRPSAKCLLESPFFPAAIRSAYLFLSPIHLLAKSGSCLEYAKNVASGGALKSMGAFASEISLHHCLPLIMKQPLSDVEAESALCLLKEFLKCLRSETIKTFVLPCIQKILQDTNYSHLKVSLLQNSFVREIWMYLGKQVYLEKIHPLIISNLLTSHKNSASAASVLLIGSSEEMGVPVTVHQTIVPLIQRFGKGFRAECIDTLVRIGGHLGDNFIIKQLLPLLRSVIISCFNASNVNKPEPLQSWNALALIDAFAILDGFVPILPSEVVLQELIQDQPCLHVHLLQKHVDLSVQQVVVSSLVNICQRIGPDPTAVYVLPQLREFFEELAFTQEADIGISSGNSIKSSKAKLDGIQIENRIDLVLILYPFFVSLLGIEKLRQYCATWLLLEQRLQRFHNWKLEFSVYASRTDIGDTNDKRPFFIEGSTSDYNPAKLLLNGVGWSIPQSQKVSNQKKSTSFNPLDNDQEPPILKSETSDFRKQDPWFWFSCPDYTWDGPDFVARVRGIKDELPWKIRASVLCSIRAHHGALKSLAVSDDECAVFTGGVGPGFKGIVQRWELSRMACTFAYNGHDEVVNQICILSNTGRIASCDGTIHVWNSQTGKLIAVYAEHTANLSYVSSSLTMGSKMGNEQANLLNSNTLSGGILSDPFSGSMYTCMHYLQSDGRLVAGMGNGSIRFIDLIQDKKLHQWKIDIFESSFPSFVSAICSYEPKDAKVEGYASPSPWIATGLSSGHCKLLDIRSGDVVASWRAHDTYITKLAVSDDHLLISSSLDKSLRIWDLRRNGSLQSNVFRGHSDGISSFSMWGQHVISISRNKIGLSSIDRCIGEDSQQILPRRLYSADKEMKNLSTLTSINILPFSRLFIVGTEDGYLKICT